MKMKMKLRAKSFVSVILVISLLTIPFKAKVLATDNSLQNNNEYVFFSELVSQTNPNLSIAEIRSLKDFSGNEYVLIECNPTGYLIYHRDSATYSEYSESAPSPFVDVASDEDIRYVGPTEYYVRMNGVYQNTLWGDIVEAINIDDKVKACVELHEKLLSQKNVALLSISKEKNYINHDQMRDQIIIAAPQSFGLTLVPYSTFLSTTNKYTFGYIELGNGVCGYISSNLLLRYWAYRGSISIPSIYTSFSGVSNGLLTKELVRVGLNELNLGYATYAWDQKEVINRFLTNNALNGSATWLLGDLSIVSQIDSGKPVIIFGNIGTNVHPQTNHAVVGYGYQFVYIGDVVHTEYVTHFGYPGYSNIVINGIIGSNTRLSP